ncbi:cytochrome P450 6B5-like [Leguminivora glycinivorella]|uniref:cytochrome P450 6B5-like n=1 Tax=Leguminivora glycinivorella TaxID=1035111 RepID=UPI00200D237D|nr:cytochrome P450 6B5-like [Leguminivora glycinivorella]
MTTYLLVGLAVVAYCFYLYFTRTFNYWRSRNVVGPTPVPIFGNVKESALRRENITMVFKNIYEAYSNEKVVGVYRMTTPDLLIRDADIVKQVMIKDFDIFADRGIRYDTDGLGTNLFHADEKTWRILRNKLTPIFTSGKLKNMLHLIIDRSDHFMKYVENLTETQTEQDVFQLAQKFTIAAISACAFGLDIDITEQNNVMEALMKLDKSIFTNNYTYEIDMMYPGMVSKLGLSLFPTDVRDFFHNIVRQVVNERNGKATNRQDFMDLILELKEAKRVQVGRITEEEEMKSIEITEGLIAAQAFVFYGAGYETSATTLGFMFMQLALNPEIQEKVVAEIEEVLKRYNDKITYEALQEMSYLERVFDETLRMYPVVDPLFRKVGADYKIPETDVELKKGQTVLVSASGIHHDAKYWPNPSKFDPDRFTSENSAGRHPAVYLPFGIGRRQCIGMRFAKVQSRVCAARLLRRFRLEPTDNTPRELRYNPNRIVLTIIGGCKLNLLPRK